MLLAQTLKHINKEWVRCALPALSESISNVTESLAFQRVVNVL
jgi:hypothetical protein